MARTTTTMTGRLAARRAALLAALLAGACSETPSEPAPRPTPPTPTAERPHPMPAVAPLSPTTYPAPQRLIAIGDVHGDLSAFRAALRLGGAIDAEDRWAGGELVVVQVGDVLDRGDDEPEVLALVERLETEARAAGGRFIALHGNHEVMNGALDFRYVTPEGFTDFDAFRRDASPTLAAALARAMRGRAAAFVPGGRYARVFAHRNVVVKVGDTVFLHGGLHPRWAAVGMEPINRSARAFFLGEAALAPALQSQDGPVWYRGYAMNAADETCRTLDAALETVGAARMVIGHTVQPQGINAACDGRVWRIDVGLARHYGGPVEVLEMVEGQPPRPLRGSR